MCRSRIDSIKAVRARHIKARSSSIAKLYSRTNMVWLGTLGSIENLNDLDWAMHACVLNQTIMQFAQDGRSNLMEQSPSMFSWWCLIASAKGRRLSFNKVGVNSGEGGDKIGSNLLRRWSCRTLAVVEGKKERRWWFFFFSGVVVEAGWGWGGVVIISFFC